MSNLVAYAARCKVRPCERAFATTDFVAFFDAVIVDNVVEFRRENGITLSGEFCVLGVDLARAIEERWADYLLLCREGATYSAGIRLAEIAHCLRFAHLAPELALKWSGVLEAVVVSSDMIRSIRNEVQRNVERLNQMLVGSTPLIYEEMLLLITIRVELEVLMAHLTERGVSDLPDVGSLDEDLSATVRSPQNSGAYLAAQQSARKNWGLPLRSKWLGTEATH